MFWIGVLCSVIALIVGGCWLIVEILCYIDSQNDKEKQYMIRAAIIMILGASVLGFCTWGDMQFEKSIEETESLINSYQLEVTQTNGESTSIEKIGNTYLYTRKESNQKVSLSCNNVNIIEKEECTQPSVSVYETTRKSSANPKLLGFIYFNSNHGSSTTIRYEITVPMGTAKVIAEDY